MRSTLTRLLVPFVAALLAGPLALGCASVAPETEVRKRAAFDLNCPAAEIALTAIDYDTYGAQGCGHRARYTKMPPNGTWILEAASPGAAPLSAPRARP